MDTPHIVEELKQPEQAHGGSLNHWVGGIMNIAFQTHYDLQYLTMQLSGYTNDPTESALPSLRHVTQYLMQHMH